MWILMKPLKNSLSMIRSCYRNPLSAFDTIHPKQTAVKRPESSIGRGQPIGFHAATAAEPVNGVTPTSIGWLVNPRNLPAVIAPPQHLGVKAQDVRSGRAGS